MLKYIAALIVILGGVLFVTRKTSSTIRVERTFNTSVEKMWKTWNDAESMKKWWSPKDFTAPIIQNDLQVGGKFLFSMKSPKDEMFWNTGEYKEIIPLQKIVSHLSFSDENGNTLPGSKAPVPGDWPDFVVVTVTFEDIAGKTKVTVTEEGIPTIIFIFAKMGWEQQFDKLESIL